MSDVLAEFEYAHTSPLLVLVEDRPAVSTEDVRWCLRWLAAFEKTVVEHARGLEPAEFHTLSASVEAAGERLRRRCAT